MLMLGFELSVRSTLALAAYTVAAPGTVGQVGDFVLSDLLRRGFAWVQELPWSRRFCRWRRGRNLRRVKGVSGRTYGRPGRLKTNDGPRSPAPVGRRRLAQRLRLHGRRRAPGHAPERERDHRRLHAHRLKILRVLPGATHGLVPAAQRQRQHLEPLRSGEAASLRARRRDTRPTTVPPGARRRAPSPYP